jgi:hypothetical protein
MRAVRVSKLGGPEVLTLEAGVAIPVPGPLDVLVKVSASLWALVRPPALSSWLTYRRASRRSRTRE